MPVTVTRSSSCPRFTSNAVEHAKYRNRSPNHSKEEGSLSLLLILHAEMSNSRCEDDLPATSALLLSSRSIQLIWLARWPASLSLGLSHVRAERLAQSQRMTFHDGGPLFSQRFTYLLEYLTNPSGNAKLLYLLLLSKIVTVPVKKYLECSNK